MRFALLLGLLAPLVACRGSGRVATDLRCEGAPARAVSQDGTLNVVWGAGTRFFVRLEDRTLELVIDRPEQVSSDVLQGLSSRRVRVSGRESASTAKLCADAVQVIEGNR